MAIATRQSLALETLLKLGRVSNLPTVWTNVLTGTVLGGGSPWSGRTSIVALAMSTRFAVDTRRAPQRIVDAHPSDQRVQTRIDLWPTTCRSGLPAPVTTKTDTVPPHQGLGSDDPKGVQR